MTAYRTLDILKAACQERGLVWAHVCRQAEVNYDSILSIARNNRPLRPEMIARLCRVLGLDGREVWLHQASEIWDATQVKEGELQYEFVPRTKGMVKS